MAKQNMEKVADLLVFNKNDLKKIIEDRIKLGVQLAEQEEKLTYQSFLTWNKFNENIFLEIFEENNNRHYHEYKLKTGGSILTAFYGDSTQKKEISNSQYALSQVRKLKQFYDTIDFLRYSKDYKDNTEVNIYDLGNLIQVLKKFHRVAQELRNRYDGRETIIVANEYDVQDLLYALLQIHYSEIRKEEASPSHAGANSRIDFVLREQKTIIEVKMTNDKMTTKKLGEDLLVDIARYKEYPNCNTLIIFIYDKLDFIRNKPGFTKDLEKNSTSECKIKVIISPE